VPGTHAVALVTNDVWDEAALTWNTRPASGLPVATWLPQANAPALVSVANAVLQDLPANGLLSLRVTQRTPPVTDGWITHRRKRWGARPQLSLYYTNAQPLSATQSFWVTVTAPQPPLLTGMQYGGGVFSV